MSSLHKELMKSRLLPPSGSVSVPKRSRDYTPTHWNEYFDSSDVINISSTSNCFRAYFKGNDGPLLYLLHGGGHSALSWCVFTKALIGLVHCQIIAIDIRGHGDTVTTDDNDLSNDILIKDISDIYHQLYQDTPPPTILMGHSMGGAIAVRVAAAGTISTLVGLAVIDVVEGTAMQSLSGMQSFLRGRPLSFSSLEQAIEWSIRSGQLRNIESAKVSMAGQLKKIEKVVSDVGGASTVGGVTDQYQWRIDLTKTEQYWREWFEGLSKTLLSTTIPKILILAGVDRLDKELTIGQMQGKFQMQVLSGCGHAVHEDAPDKVAEVIASFLLRHKLTTAKDSFQRVFPAC